MPRTKANNREGKQPESCAGERELRWGEPQRPGPPQDQKSNKSSQVGAHLRQENAEAQ